MYSTLAGGCVNLVMDPVLMRIGQITGLFARTLDDHPPRVVLLMALDQGALPIRPTPP
jgi:hypothetical protein